MHGLINEEVDFHTTKIRRAFRRSVPFLKDFWEPMSVVTYDEDSIHNGYKHINEMMDSHITEIRRAFRRSVPFLKDFWEPMSVNVRVVLLVEDDATLYTMVTIVSTKG
jgi:hypothetical protein